MINIEKKVSCCGCATCAQACPKHCIEMREDMEGFLYPHVKVDKCINCGICEKLCPVSNKEQKLKDELQAFAAYNLDEVERMQSSSGGIFSLLAKQVLLAKGVVFGAAMSEDCYSVHHIKVESLDDLHRLRGSKYLQSDTGTTYVQAQQELEKDRMVLYSGTPCQIGGLKAYLRKEYDNLICIDVICHGTPSPKLWKKYVRYRENCAGAAVQQTFFRHKKYGWKMFAVLFEFTNSTTYKQILFKDLFIQMFLQNICLRPSCYSCAFKATQDKADISLADLWGAEAICPELDDDKGLSLVLIHSAKGRKVYNSIKNDVVSKQVEIGRIILSNRAITESCAKPDIRDSFMEDMDNLTIDQLGKKYLKAPSLYARVRIWLSINIKKRIKKR